jgi:hypothetical protein
MSATFSEAPASWNTKYLRPDGFVCQLTLRAQDGADLLPKTDQAIEWLKAHDCKPMNGYKVSGQGNGQSAANGNTPLCPTHGKPMKPSKYGGWYCPVKIADDDGTGKPVYCKQKVK